MMLSSTSTRLVTALALCLLPGTGLGQASPERAPGTAAAREAAPRAAREADQPVLGSDPRLGAKVTLKKRSTTVANALRGTDPLTDAKLAAEGNEVLPYKLSFAYRDVPLRAVLASIAAVRNWEWQRQGEDLLVLRERYDRAQASICIGPAAKQSGSSTPGASSSWTP